MVDVVPPFTVVLVVSLWPLAPFVVAAAPPLVMVVTVLDLFRFDLTTALPLVSILLPPQASPFRLPR